MKITHFKKIICRLDGLYAKCTLDKSKFKRIFYGAKYRYKKEKAKFNEASLINLTSNVSNQKKELTTEEEKKSSSKSSESEKLEKSETSKKSEKSEKSEKLEKSERSEKSENSIKPEPLEETEKSIKSEKLENTSLENLRSGDFDKAIVCSIRCGKFDVRQLTSGVSYKHRNSIFHRFANHLGIDVKDKESVVELYRILNYNVRSIRDRKEIKCDGCGDGDWNTELEKNDIEPLHPQIKIEKNFVQSKPFPVSKPPPIEVTPEPIVETPKPKPVVKPEPKPKPKPSMSKSTKSESKVESATESVSTKPPGPVVNIVSPEDAIAAANGEGIKVTCPFCGYNGKTVVQYRIGNMTYAAIVGMLVVGLVPCAWMPVIATYTKDTLHICKKCKKILGLVRKDFKNRKIVEWTWDSNTKLPKKYRKINSGSHLKDKMHEAEVHPHKQAATNIKSPLEHK